MSLSTQVGSLATRVATEIKAVRAEMTSRTPKIIVLNDGAAVPAGTTVGTVILRRPA